MERKRFLAVVMTVMMVISMIPSMVFAAAPSGELGEKLSPENQIFQKKFESCRNSSQKRKKQVILLYRTAEDQFSRCQDQ